VLELDESFGTFLSSTPTLLGVLNVEADHLDFYDTEENVLAAFTQVARQTTGAVVVWADDPGAAAVGRAVSGITVGTDPQHDAVVRDLTSGPQGASCQLSYRSQSVHISLRVPGRHNIANAAVVAVLALEDGFEVGAIEQGLSNFAGAPRRFTRRGTWRGMPVIEDYAHLPREIAATLAAIYDIGARSPVVVYQPHRFSRTRDQLATIGSAFVGECTVIVTDIYGAGESDPGTVSGADVADRLPASAHAHYVGALADVPGVLNTLDGDALVLMGAGDVASVLSMLDVTP
jgi:UDP-N-acetylmuramate--alanine ligase